MCSGTGCAVLTSRSVSGSSVVILLQLLVVVCSDLCWMLCPPCLLLCFCGEWPSLFINYWCDELGDFRQVPCWQPLLLDLLGLPCRPGCLPLSSSSLSGLLGAILRRQLRLQSQLLRQTFPSSSWAKKTKFLPDVKIHFPFVLCW